MTVWQVGVWIVFTVLALADVATAGPPSWVRKPPRDDAQRMYAVGIASEAVTVEGGRREAVADAVRDLGVRAASEVQSRFEAVRTTLTRRVEDEIQVRSPKVNMAGSMVQAWDFERTRDGRYSVWVLLALPKEAMEREAKRQAEAEAVRAMEVDDLRRKAGQAEQEGRVMDAIHAYAAVLGAGGRTETGQETQAKLADLLGRLRLEAVPGAAAVRAVQRVGGQDVPGQGMPVCFLDPAGETIGVGITDASGRVYAVPGAVEAQIDVGEVFDGDEELAEKLPHIRATVESPKRDQRVVVQIVEVLGGREVAGPLAGGRIASALRGAGFCVVVGGRADIRVEGRFEGRVPAERPFNVHLALVEAHVRAVREDGEIVCAIDEPGIPGFGNDKEAAEADAVDRAARAVARKLVAALGSR